MSMSSKPPARELEQLAQRLGKELGRTGAATARVGGVVKLGVAIDAVLRRALVAGAPATGKTAKELLLNQRCRAPIDKAPTGKLLAALDSIPHWSEPGGLPQWVNDVVNATPRVRDVVQVRNRVKGPGSPAPRPGDIEKIRVLHEVVERWQRDW